MAGGRLSASAGGFFRTLRDGERLYLRAQQWWCSLRRSQSEGSVFCPRWVRSSPLGWGQPDASLGGGGGGAPEAAEFSAGFTLPFSGNVAARVKRRNAGGVTAALPSGGTTQRLRRGGSRTSKGTRSPSARRCAVASGVFLPHIKKRFWAPPGRQTLRTRGQVFPRHFMGCALDLRAKRAGTTQMYFCLPVPLHPKAKWLRSPWKSAPAFAAGCGCGAHAGAISSGLPQQTARPSRNIVFPISGVQSARRAVGATSPPRPPSYRSQGDTRALTRAPSAERPWQGETLLPLLRWVHTLYGQRCAPGGMLRPPLASAWLCLNHLRAISHGGRRGKPQAAAQGQAEPRYRRSGLGSLSISASYLQRDPGGSFTDPLSPSPSPGPVRAQRADRQGQMEPRRHPAMGLDHLDPWRRKVPSLSRIPQLV